jgi:hypothetical protein
MSNPEVVVRDYLAAMEARDLARAQSHLAPGFRMEFPGRVRMDSLQQLIEWAKPRYRFVTKTYHRFDVAGNGPDAVVYCYGALAGEWPDGSAFADIRFIDRFTVRGGLLVDQTVWNDLGEVRSSHAA